MLFNKQPKRFANVLAAIYLGHHIGITIGMKESLPRGSLISIVLKNENIVQLIACLPLNVSLISSLTDWLKSIEYQRIVYLNRGERPGRSHTIQFMRLH
jgi:hypothetical protein